MKPYAHRMDLNPVQPGGEYPVVGQTDHWPQPDAHLHVSTAAWKTSENYDKAGPAVVRALFDAVVELEKAVHDLKGDHRAS